MKKRLPVFILTFVLLTSIFVCPAFAARSTEEVVEAALKLLYYNEGSYGSVNANDNGAVSVGKIQWHANRALKLLKTIVNANKTEAKSILGETLYNEILTATSWKSRTVNDTEKSAISKLLKTTQGKAAQDALATKDVTAYINRAKNLGIVDDAALVYFADLENQGGSGMSTRVAKSASKTVGSYAKITLSDLHNAALNDSVAGYYSSRRNKTYKYCNNLNWSVTYTVTFDADGGTCSAKSIKVNAGSSAGTFPTPTRPDYEFVAWYTDPISGVRVNGSATISKDTTLYAHWKALTCIITFDPNGGTCSTTSLKVPINQPAGVTFPTPTRAGYEFVGWCNSIGSFLNSSQAFSGDTTLLAYWKPALVTITLDANGGTCDVPSITGYYGDPIGSLPVPIRDGYEFLGWYRKGTSGAMHLVDSNTKISSTTNYLWAYWNEIHNHTYSQNEVISSTCTEGGYISYSCPCGDTYTDPTPAIGHTEVTDEAVAATCTADGKTEGKHCSVCNTVIKAQETVKATGHKWDDGVITRKPTATAEGEKTYTCTVCDKTKTEAIVATGECARDESCALKKFTDTANTWAHDGIEFVVNNGLMNGTGSGSTFDPTGTMTRAMLVTVLYRNEGSPKAGDHPFTDLTQTWYEDAVAWAAENGIVKGNSATTFNPDAPVTREQIATIMYRYAEYKGVDVSTLGDISGFPDAAKVDSWAEKGTKWAVGARLITGKGTTDGAILAPTGDADRASVATILMRFIQTVVE